jgi:hypothetical protein
VTSPEEEHKRLVLNDSRSEREEEEGEGEGEEGGPEGGEGGIALPLEE